MGHSKYGPISLVFGKDTVDPEFFRSNKVYGSDAWTPTRPAVEYPVNGKKLQAIEHEIHRLAGGAAVAGGIFAKPPGRGRFFCSAFQGSQSALEQPL